MDNETEQKANIKFCLKLGKTLSETHNMLKEAYGKDCLAYYTVNYWYTRFVQGKEDIADALQSPRTSFPENVEKVLNILRSDCYVSVDLIESLTGISTTIINRILKEDLGKKKVCERFVPLTLTKNKKEARVMYCKDVNEAAGSDSMNNIVTSGRIWISQYEPLTEQQNASTSECQSPEETKSERMQMSRIKTLLIVFFDSRGMIYKKFIPEGQTVNADYYLGILKDLCKKISQVRPEYKERGSWCLLHDDAPAHKSKIVCDFLVKKGITALEYPPHSPDLTPYDFWLFPKLKARIEKMRYNNIKDMENDLKETLEKISVDGYKGCFEMFFFISIKKCIEEKGEHVDIFPD